MAEIEYGLQRLAEGRRRADLSARFETFIGALIMLPLDETAARLAGRFHALRDAAGIAVAHDAALATRNVKDFAGLPVRVIDPWQAD